MSLAAGRGHGTPSPPSLKLLGVTLNSQRIKKTHPPAATRVSPPPPKKKKEGVPREALTQSHIVGAVEGAQLPAVLVARLRADLALVSEQPHGGGAALG